MPRATSACLKKEKEHKRRKEGKNKTKAEIINT